jgi:hypothetical protein
MRKVYHEATDENISVSLAEIRAYSDAIINGIGDALVNLLDDISHPVDNIILPITDFIYDSAVIIAKHSPKANDDMLFLQLLIEANPQMYSASAQRMQRRVNDIIATVKFLHNASGPERVRALVSMGATIYVPGKIFTAARSIVINVRAFGTPTPPRYHTSNTSVDWSTFKPIKKLSYDEISAMTGKKELMYVINKERELLITEQVYDH